MEPLRAFVDCRDCDETYDGYWPAPDEDEQQDQDEAPVAEQVCPNCGRRQTEEFPGWSFHTEAG